MKVKQINNIIIVFNGRYSCRHGGKIYEEFYTLPAAEKWCRATRDFVKGKK